MRTQWSFSSLTLYEECPHRYSLKYIQKIPEPDRGPDNPMERGNAVHKALEDYLTGQGDLPVEANKLESDYQTLKTYPLVIEEEWGFTKDWQITDWNAENVSCRMKLDAIHTGGDSCLIVDHKTGNQSPIKHASQGQLYAVGASRRNPDLENFKVEFWYVDRGTKSSVSYRKAQIPKLQQGFDRRVDKMLADTRYNPISNKSNCRFCPYGDNGNAQCTYRFPQ